MTQRPQETAHGFNMRLVETIYDRVEHGKMVEAANLITARQLDAMKEGMRRAAKVKLPVFQLPTGYTGNRYIHGVHFESGNAHGVAETRQAILTAAEQLTEKDL